MKLLLLALLLLSTSLSAQPKYLGQLSADPYGKDSTSNPYGKYGSKYSPDSINNPYGKYGSKYSNQSANNPYATNAPRIVRENGGLHLYSRD